MIHSDLLTPLLMLALPISSLTMYKIERFLILQLVRDADISYEEYGCWKMDAVIGFGLM